MDGAHSYRLTLTCFTTLHTSSTIDWEDSQLLISCNYLYKQMYFTKTGKGTVVHVTFHLSSSNGSESFKPYFGLCVCLIIA